MLYDGSLSNHTPPTLLVFIFIFFNSGLQFHSTEPHSPRTIRKQLTLEHRTVRRLFIGRLLFGWQRKSIMRTCMGDWKLNNWEAPPELTQWYSLTHCDTAICLAAELTNFHFLSSKISQILTFCEIAQCYLIVCRCLVQKSNLHWRVLEKDAERVTIYQKY